MLLLSLSPESLSLSSLFVIICPSNDGLSGDSSGSVVSSLFESPLSPLISVLAFLVEIAFEHYLPIEFRPFFIFVGLVSRHMFTFLLRSQEGLAIPDGPDTTVEAAVLTRSDRQQQLIVES